LGQCKKNGQDTGAQQDNLSHDPKNRKKMNMKQVNYANSKQPFMNGQGERCTKNIVSGFYIGTKKPDRNPAS
jgi:hypothetical protein